MKKILYLFFFGTCISAYAQNSNYNLVVSFSTEIDLRNPATRLDILGTKSSDFQQLVNDYHFELFPAIPFSEQRFSEMEKAVIARKGNASSIQKLRNLFYVQLPQQDDMQLKRLATALKQLEGVNYTSLMSKKPTLPPFDIAPTTTNYQALQNYIGTNPGLNMQYAWDQNLFGQGINVRDVEYGVNLNHEELNEKNVIVPQGMTIEPSLTTAYTEHGTAVIGILYSDNGTYGTTGLVHKANEVILYPEYTVEQGYDRLYAISQAIDASNRGDVILFEMQTEGADGSTNGYAPAEYDTPVWDLTRAASDLGIVIVAAAGNGNQNLDDALYQEYMDLGHSGAIMVGAGTSNTNHNKLSFSNYGVRLDLQGWGQQVFTTGYGNAYAIAGDTNQWYTNFSGTSSATPLVASCVINLQCYYHLQTGDYLEAGQLTTILQETGIAQGDPGNGRIGEFPNMKTALEKLTAVIAVEELKTNAATYYPNPTIDHLTIELEKSIEMATVKIINSIGQIIYNQEVKSKESINTAFLTSGIYTIQIDTEKGVKTGKLVK